MYTFEEINAVLGNVVPLTEEQYRRLDTYAEMLVEYNERVNLTAITAPHEMLVKHFEDCAHVCAHIPQGASVVDVGTGAGFPGLIVAMLRDDVRVTLMDSIAKKLDFVCAVADELGLECEMVNVRAEVAGRDAEFRESFDVATARAVAELNTLAEFCLPLVKVGGRFVAMKGSDAVGELERGRFAIGLLGGGEATAEQFELSDGSKRAVVVCEKVAQTPEKYPRAAAQIKKKPLVGG